MSARAVPAVIVSLALLCLTAAARADAAGALALPAEGDLRAHAAAELDEPNVAPPEPGELAGRVSAMADRLDPVNYDPALRAEQLGPGVDLAFAYVRDHVWFDAYPGVLRGARGTYMSRAGNAADRALLLAELLRAKGIETRFARGRLSRDDAERLFDRIFEPPVAPEQDAPTAAAGEAAGEGPADPSGFAQRLRARATRDYATIIQALGDERPAPPSQRSQVIDEITPHVWVQANVDGEWVDLDTAFADAAPGRRFAEPGQTSATLPEDLHQRVTIRVVAERLTDARLTSETVLETTRPVIDLLERQVFVLHAPPAASTGAFGMGRALGAGDPDTWIPVLLIDDDVTRGQPIRFGTTPASGDDRTKPPARSGGFGGLFESLPSGAGQSDEAAEPGGADGSVFVAEHLEFELAAPGRKPEVVRRVLVDRGGPAWRQTVPMKADALRPLERHGDQPAAAQAVHNVWFSAGRHDLAAYADAAAMLVPPDDADPGAAPELTREQQLWALSMQSLPAVLWGAHGLVPALNDHPDVRFYEDAPRIVLFSFTATPEGDGQAIHALMDLRHDRVRGVARDDADADAVLRRKIWYGTLAGALEHELMAMQCAAIGGDDAEVTSTSALLDERGVVVLRRGNREWRSRVTDRAMTARISSALDAGQTLVVPAAVLDGSSDVATGWWSLTNSGDTTAVWSGDVEAGGSGFSIRTATGKPLQGGTGGVYRVFDDATSIRESPPRYRPRPRGGASQEYVNLLDAVSLPVSELWGTAVGRVVVTGATTGVAAVTALVGYVLGG